MVWFPSKQNLKQENVFQKISQSKASQCSIEYLGKWKYTPFKGKYTGNKFNHSLSSVNPSDPWSFTSNLKIRNESFMRYWLSSYLFGHQMPVYAVGVTEHDTRYWLSSYLFGHQMPVYAVGVTDHETPFTFGNSVPPLTFLWSANSREVLQLHSVFHKVSTPGHSRLFPQSQKFRR